jgi:hypothetical protein
MPSISTKVNYYVPQEPYQHAVTVIILHHEHTHTTSTTRPFVKCRIPFTCQRREARDIIDARSAQRGTAANAQQLTTSQHFARNAICICICTCMQICTGTREQIVAQGQVLGTDFVDLRFHFFGLHALGLCCVDGLEHSHAVERELLKLMHANLALRQPTYAHRCVSHSASAAPPAHLVNVDATRHPPAAACHTRKS